MSEKCEESMKGGIYLVEEENIERRRGSISYIPSHKPL